MPSTILGELTVTLDPEFKKVLDKAVAQMALYTWTGFGILIINAAVLALIVSKR